MKSKVINHRPAKVSVLCVVLLYLSIGGMLYSLMSNAPFLFIASLIGAGGFTILSAIIDPDTQK